MRADDVPLLRWLSASYVARWWPPPAEPGALEERYLARIEGRDPTKAFVIEIAGSPAGLIQACPSPASSSTPATCAVDLLLGTAELIGHGLGAGVIAAFVTDYVFDEMGAELCTADPDAENLRSIRALEKAGFRPQRTFIEGGREHILMVRYRTG